MKALLCLLLVFGTISCTKSNKELGSVDNPIKVYFTPSSDAETITSTSQDFIKYLEAETGLKFKSAVPTSYIAVVEAFGSNRADVAVMNSFGYLMANEKYGASAKLSVVRYGEKTYRGMIVASNKSGINKIEDLNGKTFAFTDASSTSGYLFPLKMINEKNIKLGNHMFAMKHDIVVSMVYQGQVDAGAAFYSPPSESGEIRDARAKVKTQFPDVEQKVKIIALTDEILNDPFVFRKDLDVEVTKKFITAIKKYLSTDEGKKVFRTIYSVEDVIDITDADYDGLRQMIKVNNINPEELLKKQ